MKKVSLKVNCTPFARKKDMPKKLVIDELRSKLKWAIKEVAYAYTMMSRFPPSVQPERHRGEHSREHLVGLEVLSSGPVT